MGTPAGLGRRGLAVVVEPLFPGAGARVEGVDDDCARVPLEKGGHGRRGGDKLVCRVVEGDRRPKGKGRLKALAVCGAVDIGGPPANAASLLGRITHVRWPRDGSVFDAEQRHEGLLCQFGVAVHGCVTLNQNLQL